jgi:hypothetical protein
VTHLRKMMLAELQRRNYGRKVQWSLQCWVLPPTTGWVIKSYLFGTAIFRLRRSGILSLVQRGTSPLRFSVGLTHGSSINTIRPVKL